MKYKAGILCSCFIMMSYKVFYLCSHSFDRHPPGRCLAGIGTRVKTSAHPTEDAWFFFYRRKRKQDKKRI